MIKTRNIDEVVFCSSFPQFDLPAEEYADCLPDGELLPVPLVVEENNDTSGPGGPVPSPSLDFNDNEDIPTELSDSSETHDEGKPKKSLLFISTELKQTKSCVHVFVSLMRR